MVGIVCAVPDFLIDGPSDAEWTYAFAHGAGGPMRTPFMSTIARGLGAEGIRVVRFEFPYMAARKRVPDQEPVLLESWRQVVTDLGNPKHLVIGGKSLGGRIATIIADQMQVAGVLCYGYPFHPPGNASRLRTAHLKTLRTPALIVQGTRDAFGNAEEVPAYGLSPSIRLDWIPEGDHSLKPPARSGLTERENLETAVRSGVTFITSL
jgi:hypothetical protein